MASVWRSRTTSRRRARHRPGGFRILRSASGDGPTRTPWKTAALETVALVAVGLIVTAFVVGSGSFNAGNQFCPAVVRDLVDGSPAGHTPCSRGALARSLLAA